MDGGEVEHGAISGFVSETLNEHGQNRLANAFRAIRVYNIGLATVNAFNFSNTFEWQQLNPHTRRASGIDANLGTDGCGAR